MKQISFIRIILILILANYKAFCQSGYYYSLVVLEEKIFSAKDTTIVSALIREKITLHIKHKNHQKAFTELKRLEKIATYQSFSENELWNATLLSTQFDDYNEAVNFYETYKYKFDSISVKSNLLGFLVHVNTDSLKANSYLNKLVKQNDSLACLSCFYKLAGYNYKKGTFFKVSSLIVPGSGLIMMGKPIKGITALAISAAFVASGIYFYNAELFINGIGWTVGWGTKFYFGQFNLTEREYVKKQDKRKTKLAIKCKSDFETQMKNNKIDYVLLR